MTRRWGGIGLAASLLALGMGGTGAAASSPGETFTCHFGRYGEVSIDTRYPDASITINGRRYPAQDGSYFYQSKDGSIAVMFGPNMTWWTYNDVDDHHCTRRANKSALIPKRERKRE